MESGARIPLVPAREEGLVQAESVMVLHYRVVAFRSASQRWTVCRNPLGQGATEGDSPVLHTESFHHVLTNPRVVLFESTAQNGWYVPSKTKYIFETDSEQVP